MKRELHRHHQVQLGSTQLHLPLPYQYRLYLLGRKGLVVQTRNGLHLHRLPYLLYVLKQLFHHLAHIEHAVLHQGLGPLVCPSYLHFQEHRVLRVLLYEDLF